MPNADRPNDFDLIYRDASQKHGPAVNVRRPFTLDLVYPVAELTPFIGKMKSNSRYSVMLRRQRIRKVSDQKPLETDPEMYVAAYESE